MNHFVWFVINALGCSINVGFYAWSGNPLSLAVAAFTGLVALAMLALAVTE